MTAIFLASQCEFSRFTDKPVEENGYQDVKCYNTDNLLPLRHIAPSLCICLLQGLEATWLFFTPRLALISEGSKWVEKKLVGVRAERAERWAAGDRLKAKGPDLPGNDMSLSDVHPPKEPQVERQF